MPRHREPSAGLVTAFKRLQFLPDPPGLDLIRGNNRVKLRAVAKLIHVICDGCPGTKFFLSSVDLGMLCGGVFNAVALRWLKQLEKQGIITRTWIGRPVRNDEFGHPIAGGRLVDRASEYVYHGIPTK